MDRLTLRDALLGGPGLDGYVYESSEYCVEHGQQITRKLFRDVGTLDEPGTLPAEDLPSPVFFGESDTAQYCEECGEYLYGGKTVEEFIDEHRTDLYNAIWKQSPNLKLDDDDVAQWIANDEGLYQWAREEGVRV